jgi:hypothetical protein
MSDLRIDPTAGSDLVITDGKLQLVTGAEARAQRIGIALRHFKGEWFLDVNAGTDHWGRILGKSSDLSRRAEIRRRVLSVPGVREITSLDLQVDPRTRALSGTVQALDITGAALEVPVEGGL